ncbi:hypothetical protein [Autumnicola psychrophila]|uniref:Uncharacterized protein n=1 Tax=Autumnicola psychrophila TaxID=3075592 RepID=A0ABU3DP44_9FLAO|nr:hypothetical protein [Zunongwangia sp. F225]MDT0685481.1 hypothetical protein [Zunongwangia sp. F225]
MKHIYLFFSTIIFLGFFTNCGSKKDLQEYAPAQFLDAYTTTGSTGLELHIPFTVIQENQISLDSVYFRGMKSPLLQNEEIISEYVAKFHIKDPQMVMSGDAREEYGNKAPQRAEKSPYEIERDEAILVFSENNKTKYYKITGITEGK